RPAASVRAECEHAFVPSRAVLHADLDAFYASVEQRDDPALRGRPIAVGGWVVTAASYEAKAHGVGSGMGGAQARRLCPDLQFVRPRWDAYVQASRDVFDVFRRTSPVVEGVSIDEAFLDVRGMARSAGTPTEIALRLRWEVRDKVGLPITVGVATTKHLAKVCSALAKPDGLMVVPPGCEAALLHRLPVERLWGVGPATTARLHAAGITLVGQVAAMDEEALAAIAGRAAGRQLHHLAHNRDPRPVRAGNRRRTFGAQSALGRRPRSPEALDSVLVGLVDRVTRRMRAKDRAGRTVVLRLRFGDYATASRSRTMRRSTSASAPVLAVARGLLEEARPAVRERGLTLLGITVANLDGDGDPDQLTLPVDDEAEARSVDAALDVVRERFGPASITRASLIGRDPGLAQFLLPSGRRPARGG
ncbi:MAG TPA: DNA polymerase IV, partial [Miltoncostaea sp.]|nr:DNA polymerase IV [Miltoncostaea sp.]